MKIILQSALILAIITAAPFEIKTEYNGNPANYSDRKFFVKTKSELKISEATGRIMLSTGINSLDEKINKYNITSIESLFRLNNGDRKIFEKFEMSKIYVFNLEKGTEFSIEKILEDFENETEVDYCEPDFIGTSAGVKQEKFNGIFQGNIPNDNMFSRQWYLSNNGLVEPSGGGFAKVGADIKILSTWEIETGSDEDIVAILDSGIKDDHPDLKDRIWINEKEIPNNRIDDDNNGYVDDYKGWDFAYDDRRPEDGFGHGTNIATVIGASTNNMIGYAGINQKCKLMNCKNLNSDNSGEYSWWAESIKYAVDNGAKIINMSEGGDDYSRVLKTAIDYANESGVLVVAAMMNKGDDRDYYPASYKGVFAVGATDTDDKRCKIFSWGGGSCWGEHISVVAPGNKIYGLDYEDDDNYEVYWSGTSQSTAIVSGIASLLLAQKNSRSPDELKKIIKSTAKDLVGDPREDRQGWDKYYGYGRVDGYAALTFENDALIEKEFDKKFDEEEIPEQEDETRIEDKNYNDTKPADNKPAKALPKSSPDNGNDEER